MINAVKKYKIDSKASEEDIMFEPGKPKDPTNRWVVALSRFYKEHKIKVMSHDFRTTLVTNMYKESKDIVAC